MSVVRVIGIVLAVLSLAPGVRGIFYYLGHHPVRGLASLIVFGVLLIVGVILIIVGRRSAQTTPAK